GSSFRRRDPAHRTQRVSGVEIGEPIPPSKDSNLMTTLIDDRRASAAVALPARYFYFNMALACAAVAFLGFAPTYFLPLSAGKLSAPPSVHVHGIGFFPR